MPSAEFEPALPGSEQPKTYELDSEATESGAVLKYLHKSTWRISELRLSTLQ